LLVFFNLSTSTNFNPFQHTSIKNTNFNSLQPTSIHLLQNFILTILTNFNSSYKNVPTVNHFNKKHQLQPTSTYLNQLYPFINPNLPTKRTSP